VRARAFGYLGSVAAVAGAIGPLVGGALIAAFGASDGWRAVFYINLPIGLAVIPLAARLLPSHVPVTGKRPGLDLDGAGLLGLGIVLVLLPFIQDGWGSWRWWLLGGAAIVLAVFVPRERRVTDPLLDVRLFRHRSYSVGTTVITLYFAAITPLFFIYTLLLQLGLRYSAIDAGAAIFPCRDRRRAGHRAQSEPGPRRCIGAGSRRSRRASPDGPAHRRVDRHRGGRHRVLRHGAPA
jgi:MFS family permease